MFYDACPTSSGSDHALIIIHALGQYISGIRLLNLNTAFTEQVIIHALIISPGPFLRPSVQRIAEFVLIINKTKEVLYMYSTRPVEEVNDPFPCGLVTRL